MKREDRNDVRVRTSKALAYILRHGGAAVGLTFDDEGFVTVDDVLKGLHVLGRIHHDLTREALLLILDDPTNPRYERQGDRVRARYGHSAQLPPVAVPGGRATSENQQFPPAPAFTPTPPPDVLYHGTTARAATAILAGSGLKPQGRQFVHLSTDLKEAVRVALRHHEEMTVLRVDARAAAASELEFAHAGEHTWLTPEVPVQFISIEDEPGGIEPASMARLLPSPGPRRDVVPLPTRINERPPSRTQAPPRPVQAPTGGRTPPRGRDRPPIVSPTGVQHSIPETPPTTGKPSPPAPRGPASGSRPSSRRRPNKT